MGYYCTVPQCTSLAGKTKNVKFHRFPRDSALADKWNVILKRGKPYTKFSKVCSLHFTQSDYNVTTMGKSKGQWKTLSKDAIPSQNLPRLHPDGTVMVIRKSRTVRYKDGQSKKECDTISEKLQEKWPQTAAVLQNVMSSSTSTHDNSVHTGPVEESVAYRMQSLQALASTLTQQGHARPQKQDATIQTDPVYEEDESQLNTSYSDHSENSFHSEQNVEQYSNGNTPITNQQYQHKDVEKFDSQPTSAPSQPDNYEIPKDYTKNNEDYNISTDPTEKYPLERKPEYQKVAMGNGYQKPQEMYPDYYVDKDYPNRRLYNYEWKEGDSVNILRSQQHNLQLLHEQQRAGEGQPMFTEVHIKREADGAEDDKFMYHGSRGKETESSHLYDNEQRRMAHDQRIIEQLHQQVKTEPDPLQGCDNVMPPENYYPGGGQLPTAAYLDQYTRQPGPELLIAKQNALAAQTQLWPNTMKRPFFYSETPHYTGSQLLHRYEDLSRILQ